MLIDEKLQLRGNIARDKSSNVTGRWESSAFKSLK